jgi:hypothetical protein
MKFLKSFESYLPKWKMNYVNELEQEEIGKVLQPFEIVEYITSFHDMDSYDDTDFYERCEEYEKFVLKMIDVSEIDLDEFMLDDDKVSEYVELYREINKYPTIVVGETDNGYTIIDGLHRANALSELGFKKIRAYVGEK